MTRATRVGALVALGLATTAARCPPRRPPPLVLVVPDAPMVLAPSAASPTTDLAASLPFTLTLPPGWAPTLPSDTGAARFVHSATDARVAVWSMPTGEDSLPARADCAWSFDDTARYRAVRVASDVRVASCVPEDPGGPRVTLWLIERSERGWRIEATIPAGAAWAARPAVEDLISTVRFDR